MESPSRESDERLAELILAWEESLAAGEPVALEALCRDAPELAPALEREIGRLQSVDRFMFARINGADALDEAFTPGANGGFPSLPGYDVLEELGRGGMGVVYKARQHSLNRFVAVKSLAGGRWGQPGFVARLRQEAAALSRISHPGVVQVIDVVETDHAVSIVLEYVDGESLARRQHGAPLEPREAARVTQTIARTLAAVHDQGILHRDVKPANVLISRSGTIKVSDFGLAKHEGSSAGLTITGELLGSPAYMSPEQAQGRTGEVGVRTDVYAIGATLYELLTGRPPFQAASHVEILRQVVEDEPVSPRLLNPDVPRDLETIVLRCLEKELGRRFATARELAEELERFLHGTPIRSRPIGRVDRLWRWSRRRPAAAALVAVSAAAVFALAASLSIHYRNLTKYNSDLTRLNNDLAQATTTARALQRTAEENERHAKDALYASDMNRAAIAWREGDTQGLTELLKRHIPVRDEPDRRGYEWWFLDRQANPERRLLVDVGSPVYFLCHSPDRRLIAAAGKDAVVRLFDPATGKVSRELATGQIEVNGVAFAPDGRELATAGDDGTVRVLNLETGTERLKIGSQPDKAFQLAFTPDGKRIVACGEDPVIRVFAADSGREIGALTGHQNTVQCLVLAADGKTLVSGSNDRTARSWDLESGRELSRITTDRTVRSLVVVQDRNLVVTGNESGWVQSWDLRDGRKLSEVRHLDGIESLALHPEGKLLAVGDRSGGVRIWQMNADGELSLESLRAWQATQGIAYSLVWSSDGSQLISAGRGGRVKSWSLSAAAGDSGPFRFSVENGNAFSLVPQTSSLLTTAYTQRRLTRWNWRTGRVEASVTGDAYDDVRVSPDAMYVAVRTDAAALQVFPLVEVFQRPLSESALLSWKPGGTVRGVQFSPDSQSLAVPFQPEGTDRRPDEQGVWLHLSPAYQRNVRIPVAGAKAVAYSPDGRRLALLRDSGLVLWDSVQRIIVWETPQTDFSAVAFSPDGRLVATRGVSRLVIVRNAADGGVRFRLASHRARIEAFAFSPDSRTLATASADGVLKLWHVPTGQELIELNGPGPVCERLEFADNGRHLLALKAVPGPDENEVVVFQGAEDDPEF